MLAIKSSEKQTAYKVLKRNRSPAYGYKRKLNTADSDQLHSVLSICCLLSKSHVVHLNANFKCSAWSARSRH